MIRPLSAILLSASLAVAHHSVDQDYDWLQPADHKVTVTRLDFKNPHVLLYATERAANGAPTEWVFEMAAPNYLNRYNFDRRSLNEGDAVTVRAYAAKDGSNWGRLVRITMPDGKIFEDETSSAMPAGAMPPTKAPANGHKK